MIFLLNFSLIFLFVSSILFFLLKNCPFITMRTMGHHAQGLFHWYLQLYNFSFTRPMQLIEKGHIQIIYINIYKYNYMSVKLMPVDAYIRFAANHTLTNADWVLSCFLEPVRGIIVLAIAWQKWFSTTSWFKSHGLIVELGNLVNFIFTTALKPWIMDCKSK